MTNPFADFNIDHLSPSSLIKFRSEQANWVAHYLYGIRDDAGPAAWRGSAVESGLHAWLHGETFEAALERALTQFDLAASGLHTDDIDKARGEIEPMLRQAVGSFNV